MSVDYIKAKKPNLMAIISDQIDHTGYAIGHTTAYYETCRVDGYIGQIIQALKDAGIYDDSHYHCHRRSWGIGKETWRKISR